MLVVLVVLVVLLEAREAVGRDEIATFLLYAESRVVLFKVLAVSYVTSRSVGDAGSSPPVASVLVYQECSSTSRHRFGPSALIGFFGPPDKGAMATRSRETTLVTPPQS